MMLEELFHRAVEKLRERNVRYALAGGLATSVFRKETRTTEDVDILISSVDRPEDVARAILTELNLNISVIRRADLKKDTKSLSRNQNTPVFIVEGKGLQHPHYPGLDFLLPQFSWFESALRRAQTHQVNFGFGAVPCLTVEDIILTKFDSLRNTSRLYKDLDDLQSIFEAHHDIDLSYLCGQMRELKLQLPHQIEYIAPLLLRRESKLVRKTVRKSS